MRPVSRGFPGLRLATSSGVLTSCGATSENLTVSTHSGWECSSAEAPASPSIVMSRGHIDRSKSTGFPHS